MKTRRFLCALLLAAYPFAAFAQDRDDYAVPFTDAEFARLKRVFPHGVCDWSKDGVAQTGVVPWASFGPAPENLVFDITGRVRRDRDDDDDDD
jgi:hypothetical protein